MDIAGEKSILTTVRQFNKFYTLKDLIVLLNKYSIQFKNVILEYMVGHEENIMAIKNKVKKLSDEDKLSYRMMLGEYLNQIKLFDDKDITLFSFLKEIEFIPNEVSMKQFNINLILSEDDLKLSDNCGMQIMVILNYLDLLLDGDIIMFYCISNPHKHRYMELIDSIISSNSINESKLNITARAKSDTAYSLVNVQELPDIGYNTRIEVVSDIYSYSFKLYTDYDKYMKSMLHYEKLVKMDLSDDNILENLPLSVIPILYGVQISENMYIQVIPKILDLSFLFIDNMTIDSDSKLNLKLMSDNIIRVCSVHFNSVYEKFKSYVEARPINSILKQLNEKIDITKLKYNIVYLSTNIQFDDYSNIINELTYMPWYNSSQVGTQKALADTLENIYISNTRFKLVPLILDLIDEIEKAPTENVKALSW